MMFKTLMVSGLSALAMLAVPTVAHADTVCSSQVEAGPDTSCPFAMAVYNKMMSGAGTVFDVVSPVTGQNYTMSCSIEQHGAVTCRGGDGASVIIH